jgi:hypothetical protein
MKRIAGETLIVIAIVTVLCVLAMLVAQGRLFTEALINSPFEKPISDGCFYLSLPGVIAAVAIWGYSHERTIASDLVIVAVNAALYSTLIILLFSGLRSWYRASHP